MSRRLVLLSLLFAAAAAVWIAWPGGEEDAYDRGGPGARPQREPTAAEPEGPKAPALTGPSSSDPRSPRVRRPEWPVVRSDQIPRGGLDVRVVDLDGNALPTEGVKVQLTRPGAGFSSTPLAIRDPEKRVHAFRKVIFGRVVVHVYGDHVVETSKTAEINADEVESVDVPVEPGGAIRYRAALRDGGMPDEVTLKLLAAETGRPAKVRYQVRSQHELTQDVSATERTQGPEGVIFAIPPGRYRLLGESPEGESDAVEIEVEPGRTGEAELVLRR